MSDPRERMLELEHSAYQMPNGSTKVALLEEAVQLADSIQDLDQAYWLREQLMSAATFSRRPDIMLVAFAWCLAQCDREPDRFDADSLLWNYKWVVDEAQKFPQISRSRLEDLLVDMERRYRAQGASMYSVALERRQLMVHFGEKEAAQAAHAEFRKTRRDSFSDCVACVASKNVDYYCFLGQWKQALRAAQPVLTGRLSCEEQPQVILATILFPLLQLGRFDEARTRQAEGYRLISRGKQFVREHAAHLRFLVLTGDFAKAKRMFEKHLPGALEDVRLEDRFVFLLASCYWCDRLLSQGTRKLKLRLPDGLPSPGADGKSDVNLLRQWFYEQTQLIARQFDARNGSSSFQQQIDQLSTSAVT